MQCIILIIKMNTYINRIDLLRGRVFQGGFLGSWGSEPPYVPPCTPHTGWLPSSNNSTISYLLQLCWTIWFLTTHTHVDVDRFVTVLLHTIDRSINQSINHKVARATRKLFDDSSIKKHNPKFERNAVLHLHRRHTGTWRDNAACRR